MTELIIAEKPDAAKRIAEALADKKPKKLAINKVPYYELTHNKKKILVGCAVGHLYTLAEKKKSGFTYPVYDVEWRAAHEVKKASEFSKKYLTTLQKLAKQADSFVIACDYDQEGSVIGYNCIRFIAKKKDAKRMKFSTLTKDELTESYKKASKHLDFEQIEAGETRHYMDYFWGISLSRALTSSIKTTGSFKLLSAGRVQGPALSIIVKREKEIQKFKPVPFWEIELKSGKITAYHKDGKIFDKKLVSKILKTTKNKDGIVKSITRREFLQEPPTPFDLTTLQTESYRNFNYTPKDTLAIAQDLYTKGFISYPRTSSQKLPSSLNLKKIMQEISKQKNYSSLAKELLKTKLQPNEGKKTDPAHPAIFPTGEIGTITDKQKKVYDLITKRFLSTFAEPAKRETITCEIDVNKEIFIAKGTRTTEEGWHKFYEPYTNFKDEEIPKLKEKQVLKKPKINKLDKETQPPKRYTQASLIKELEKKNLGTKATRAQIIDALYQRHYVVERAIEATKLGIEIIGTLGKYCPEILDEDLTRYFEEELERIRESKKKEKEVLEEAKKTLTNILEHFRKNEEKIGKELLGATRETQREINTVGTCPECKKGTLIIRMGRFGKFIACDKYPKCKTTFSVPSNALVKPIKDLCPECKHYMLMVIRKGKRPWKYCISKTCPKKLEWIKQQEELKKQKEAEKKVTKKKKSKTS